jgi:hypothetical protein
MAKLFSTRNVLIAGGVGAAFYLFPRTVAKINPIQYVTVMCFELFATSRKFIRRLILVSNRDGIKTPASQAIADRFSAGGASTTHVPGAGSKRGKCSSSKTANLTTIYQQ